jgi:hypothetical protein
VSILYLIGRWIYDKLNPNTQTFVKAKNVARVQG